MTEMNSSRCIAVPRSGKGPGVLVLHAWWGLNDFIRSFCDRLAEEGFVAAAPDMFSGKTARTPDEAETLVRQMFEEQTVPQIIQSAVDELRGHPAVSGDGLGVAGFSFGGYWSLWLAEQQPEVVKAVTIFYSTGDADFRRSGAAFLGHFAEQDPFEPEEGVRALEKSLRDAERPATFYTYPGTGHWFFEKDRQDAYDAQAAQLAWERTAAFFKEHLTG